jgi:hypothetical protein
MTMTQKRHAKTRTMGQQFGRRAWAEPWKIKMVEPKYLRFFQARFAPRGWDLGVEQP